MVKESGCRPLAVPGAASNFEAPAEACCIAPDANMSMVARAATFRIEANIGQSPLAT
jgi:hypothetical protein